MSFPNWFPTPYKSCQDGWSHKEKRCVANISNGTVKRSEQELGSQQLDHSSPQNQSNEPQVKVQVMKQADKFAKNIQAGDKAISLACSTNAVLAVANHWLRQMLTE